MADVGVFAAAPALAEEHVALYVAGEEHRLLRDIAHAVVERVEAVVPHIYAVDQHLASRSVVKARYEADQRRLAGARRADEGQRFTLVCLEADVLEHVAAVGVVEAYVPELHGAGLGGFGDAALQYAGLGGENLVYTSGGDLGGGQEHDYDDKHHYAHYDVGGVGAEYDDIAEAFKPSGHILGGYGVYYGRAHPVYDQRQGVHA